MEPQESQALPAHGSIRGRGLGFVEGRVACPGPPGTSLEYIRDQRVLRALRAPINSLAQVTWMDGWMWLVLQANGPPKKLRTHRPFWVREGRGMY